MTTCTDPAAHRASIAARMRCEPNGKGASLIYTFSAEERLNGQDFLFAVLDASGRVRQKGSASVMQFFCNCLSDAGVSLSTVVEKVQRAGCPVRLPDLLARDEAPLTSRDVELRPAGDEVHVVVLSGGSERQIGGLGHAIWVTDPAAWAAVESMVAPGRVVEVLDRVRWRGRTLRLSQALMRMVS